MHIPLLLKLHGIFLLGFGVGILLVSFSSILLIVPSASSKFLFASCFSDTVSKWQIDMQLKKCIIFIYILLHMARWMDFTTHG